MPLLQSSSAHCRLTPALKTGSGISYSTAGKQTCRFEGLVLFLFIFIFNILDLWGKSAFKVPVNGAAFCDSLHDQSYCLGTRMDFLHLGMWLHVQTAPLEHCSDQVDEDASYTGHRNRFYTDITDNAGLTAQTVGVSIDGCLGLHILKGGPSLFPLCWTGTSGEVSLSCFISWLKPHCHLGVSYHD